MNTSILVVFCCIVQIRSNQLNHFIMNEAHIIAYRVNEDENAGYPPLYMECLPSHLCKIGRPQIIEADGTIGVVTSFNEPDLIVLYGCPLKTNGKKINRGNETNQKLYLKQTDVTVPKYDKFIESIFWYSDAYQNKCESEVLPNVQKDARRSSSTTSYFKIGFDVEAIGRVNIAEIYFNERLLIPIWTKHIVYGNSLSVPAATFRSVESINLDNNAALKTAIESYSLFNEVKSASRQILNDFLNEAAKRSFKHHITKAQLIPDYDMIQPSLKHVPLFGYSIAPMFTDLYTSTWLEIEHLIREAAFMQRRNFIVYSGTHSQLNFSAKVKIPFYLNEDKVPVPEAFWKIVIDDNRNTEKKKKAIVFIMHNATVDMIADGLLSEFQFSCKNKCLDLGWNTLHEANTQFTLVRCCSVDEIRDLLVLPFYLSDEHFDLLHSLNL